MMEHNATAMSLICRSAEALVHFSFAHSDKKMLLLDIKGCGHELTDPEIATLEQAGESGELYFCLGNLGIEAFTTFFDHHKVWLVL